MTVYRIGERFLKGKETYESKGQKLNLKKTKVMATGSGKVNLCARVQQGNGKIGDAH